MTMRPTGRGVLQSAAAECLGVEHDSDEAFDAVQGYIEYLATPDGARILGKPQAKIMKGGKP